jgi:ABC-type multidrug transport system ATPase subunit
VGGSQSDSNAIILEEVYLRYSKKLLGIKGLNFIVENGSILGLMGMNGSGKSTTIKLIMN